LPGPTWQTPLLLANLVVIRVGGADAATAGAAVPSPAMSSDPAAAMAATSVLFIMSSCEWVGSVHGSG
jgi:hypothetical protein